MYSYFYSFFYHHHLICHFHSAQMGTPRFPPSAKMGAAAEGRPNAANFLSELKATPLLFLLAGSVMRASCPTRPGNPCGRVISGPPSNSAA